LLPKYQNAKEGGSERIASNRLMLNIRSYIADKRKAAPGQKDALQPTNRIGRPPAKHSSPDYQQMSVYIHNDVRRKVKVRLFETGGEFSARVESLLREWLLNHESREKRRMIFSSPLTRLDLLPRSAFAILLSFFSASQIPKSCASGRAKSFPGNSGFLSISSFGVG
jgi:hypothetical protein